MLQGGPTALAGTTLSYGSGTYVYLGSSTPAFTLAGSGTLTLASSVYGDTFGTAKPNGTSLSQVFSASQALGTTVAISPGYTPFVFYFASPGSDPGTGYDYSVGDYRSSDAWCSGSGRVDCAATLFSNGTTLSGLPAGGNDNGQAALAIYYQASTGSYALFFDDGGPSNCTGNGNCHGNSNPVDDNDFNDLAVIYTPTATPEPFSMSLLGTGLIGLGFARARRRK